MPTHCLALRSPNVTLAECNAVALCNIVSAATVESEFKTYLANAYWEDTFFTKILLGVNQA
jgi:hypothetical protein